ncbi:glycophorin-C [Periophthalmus magnuspinnatus]|uniref:glycophorin-C n=1 Tax=Periophthalmus magnuspinnatus TaxID=409849 RepID=UPI00145AE262|nr:glycophorin-C [Periophthalmus magnuspinnatus]XP_055086542.1 glycophorin-C [Periophthalmus magnuspinnatus]
MDKGVMTTPSLQTEAATVSLPTAGYNMDDGWMEAVVGAVIATVVVVLLVVVLVVIRYMFRHKGSYVTNEAKGTEYAQTADAALRSDPVLKDAMDQSRKEYFI